MCRVFTICSRQLYCICVWKLNSILSQHWSVCYIQDSTCFSCIYLLLCHLCFSLLIVIVLQVRPVQIFIPNDRVLFFAKPKIVFTTVNPSLSLSQTWWIWRGMPGPLRGAGGSQPLWLWLKVNVLNRGTSHQPGIRWLPELSLHFFVYRLLAVSAPLPHFYPLSVSHFTSFHLYSFQFSGSFINLTCDSINWKLKGTKWITSTTEQ